MKEIIKKRDIHVEGMTCEGCERNINEALTALDGVEEVKADKSGTVHVEYNLTKINLDCIENKIRELNFHPGKSFFDKMKRGFINFTEQNERDNMNAEIHSCCEVPSKRGH